MTMREAERRLIILFAQSVRKSDGIIDILTEFLEADRAEQSKTIYGLTNSNRHFHERILRQSEKTAALKAAYDDACPSKYARAFNYGEMLSSALADFFEGKQ